LSSRLFQKIDRDRSGTLDIAEIAEWLPHLSRLNHETQKLISGDNGLYPAQP
jgi:hypothetical protein